MTHTPSPQGRDKLSPPPQEQAQCPTCLGSGYVTDLAPVILGRVRCPTCTGSGKVPSEPKNPPKEVLVAELHSSSTIPPETCPCGHEEKEHYKADASGSRWCWQRPTCRCLGYAPRYEPPETIPVAGDALSQGAFLKKYMDADGKGDMVQIGRAAYDLHQLINAKVVEELERLDEAWYGKGYPASYLKKRIAELKRSKS